MQTDEGIVVARDGDMAAAARQMQQALALDPDNMFILGAAEDIAKSLGVFIPLIVVNCIVLGRAEAFASKNSVAASAVDGICQGIGYTVVLVIMCTVRELLGAGTLMGIQIMPASYTPALMLVLPVGGFLCLGTLIAVMQWALAKGEKKTAEKNEKEGN